MRHLLASTALVAALLIGAASPSFADGFDGAGPSAFGPYVPTQSRSPLADPGMTGMSQGTSQGQAAQNFLGLSGASGGGGQHS